MLPEGWLDALKHQVGIVAGLLLFSVAALLLDRFAIISLSDFGSLARPAFTLAALLFGSLTLTVVGEHIHDALLQRRKQAKRKSLARTRINYLSKDELHFVADCLRRKERSFLAYVNSPSISNLIAAGIVNTPGGAHNPDRYPYYFDDFAWDALLLQRDDLIAKDDENKRQEATGTRRVVRR